VLYRINKTLCVVDAVSVNRDANTGPGSRDRFISFTSVRSMACGGRSVKALLDDPNTSRCRRQQLHHVSLYTQYSLSIFGVAAVWRLVLQRLFAFCVPVRCLRSSLRSRVLLLLLRRRQVSVGKFAL